jgi:hypothetical protein
MMPKLLEDNVFDRNIECALSFVIGALCAILAVLA